MLQMKRTIIRRYSELRLLTTYEERLAYLQIFGTVGQDTFGFDRYLNQMFYKSKEWRDVRNIVINRDKGFDLGIDGMEIPGRTIVHHMNPLTKEDIINKTDFLLNPEYLITVSEFTDRAIHYGFENAEPRTVTIGRHPNDTKLW